MTHASAPLRVAAVQLTSGDDRPRNTARAGELVARAAGAGARLVVLPERWPFIHGPRTPEAAEGLDGPSVAAAAGWAREHGVAVLAGSIVEAGAPGGRTYNTSVLIAPGGEIAGVYRKVHLFDVEVGGRAYRESAATAAGDELTVATVLDVEVGMSVCYDLRFPELYRALVDGGARILTVPAAFTATTGRDHWEPLLRARAIENQCVVVAAGQYGTHADGTVSHGRSMIVDPWGVVLAQAPDGEGLAVADVDLDRLAEVRRRLPALDHRRPGVYARVPAGGSKGSAGSQ